MIITHDLRMRLRDLLKTRQLTHAALGQELGCSGPTVSRWLNGTVTTIRPTVAARLAPLLGLTMDHLARPLPAPPSPGHPRLEDHGPLTNSAELRAFLMGHMLARGLDYKSLARLAGYDHPETLHRLLDGQLAWYPAMLAAVLHALAVSPTEAPLSDSDRARLHPAIAHGWQTRDVPVLSMAHAATCAVVNGQFDPPDFWDGERLPAPTDGRAYVAFRIEGDSMAPRIPHQALVLCDLRAEVHPGQVVVARFDDQVVCKRYRRQGNTILLASDNPADGQDFSVAADRLQWLLRAVRVILDVV